TPETKAWVNGYEVDFYWPELGIIVEADGLRYHRTASQQKRGLERDQAHLATGMWPLRFSHWQIKYDAARVRKLLRSTVARASGKGARLNPLPRMGGQSDQRMPRRPGTLCRCRRSPASRRSSRPRWRGRGRRR